MLKLLNLDASQLLHAFDTGVLKTAVFETRQSHSTMLDVPLVLHCDVHPGRCEGQVHEHDEWLSIFLEDWECQMHSIHMFSIQQIRPPVAKSDFARCIGPKWAG
jgi:hypothetical protein